MDWYLDGCHEVQFSMIGKWLDTVASRAMESLDKDTPEPI
jgi:hypothetical protein